MRPRLTTCGSSGWRRAKASSCRVSRAALHGPWPVRAGDHHVVAALPLAGRRPGGLQDAGSALGIAREPRVEPRSLRGQSPRQLELLEKALVEGLQPPAGIPGRNALA